jgi:hypothetical protein
MKLSHAKQVAERLTKRSDLSADERGALRVLIEMARRVTDTRPSLRAVVRAVYGEDLNQSEMDELFRKPQE